MIPPTYEVTRTGQEEEMDGVLFVFQLVPDSEAPAELNFHLPASRALCVAENAVHCMHNILTPRGAFVRDALAWSKYIDEAIDRFVDRSDVMFAQHHWPRWGSERLAAYLAQHRDMYRYLHDQTLRLANRGLTPTEIAETVRLPPSLERSWWCRGHYGTVSYNVRAIYQRYLGSFDGNPSRLEPHPTEQLARRYVALAAHELRQGPPSPPPAGRGRVASADVARALSIEQLWDAMAARLDGPRAWDAQIAIGWHFTDVQERWTVRVSNGAMSARRELSKDAQATVTLTRTALDTILLGEGELSEGQIAVEGDGAKLGELLGLLDAGEPSFAIVTP